MNCRLYFPNGIQRHGFQCCGQDICYQLVARHTVVVKLRPARKGKAFDGGRFFQFNWRFGFYRIDCFLRSGTNRRHICNFILYRFKANYRFYVLLCTVLHRQKPVGRYGDGLFLLSKNPVRVDCLIAGCTGQGKPRPLAVFNRLVVRFEYIARVSGSPFRVDRGSRHLILIDCESHFNCNGLRNRVERCFKLNRITLTAFRVDQFVSVHLRRHEMVARRIRFQNQLLLFCRPRRPNRANAFYLNLRRHIPLLGRIQCQFRLQQRPDLFARCVL